MRVYATTWLLWKIWRMPIRLRPTGGLVVTAPALVLAALAPAVVADAIAAAEAVVPVKPRQLRIQYMYIVTMLYAAPTTLSKVVVNSRQRL